MTDRNPLTPRILKEIRAGIVSKIFYFLCDTDGLYGAKNMCYIKWKVLEGPHKDQIHVIFVDFINVGPGKSFPKYAPLVGFMTPMISPHIHDKYICLDVLGTHGNPNSKQGWSPMYGIETIFNSLIILLRDADGAQANQYRANYNQKIKTPHYLVARKLIEAKFANE